MKIAQRANLAQRVVGATLIVSVAGMSVGCATVDAPPGAATGSSTPSAGTGGSTATAKAASVELTPAELKMRADEERFQKTVIGGVIQGAMIGAAIGAVTALISGGNTKDAARSAGIGALIGGTAGGIDGYVTAKREQAGRNELRAVQEAAKDVKADNAKLQAFLDSSDVVLKEGKTRLAALKGDISAKRITAQEAEAARNREEQNIASMKTTLAQAKKTKDEYAKAAAQFKGTPQDKSNLDAEINRMNQQVAKLESNIADYNRAVGVSRAG
jgi:predicted RNase H-like nuclease (RuvC/YqgF family)